MKGCYACDLTNGRIELPGGRIHQTDSWVVEHCTGPLGVGTLIVKPFRHCLQIADLFEVETTELGPLLQVTADVIRRIVMPNQVYVCLWSHKDWQPQHIHFVIQPVWSEMETDYQVGGPFLQSKMMASNIAPDRKAVEKICAQIREEFYKTTVQVQR